MVKLDLLFVELRLNYCYISIASIIARRLTNVRVNVIPPINISPSMMTWVPVIIQRECSCIPLSFALFSSSSFLFLLNWAPDRF